MTHRFLMFVDGSNLFGVGKHLDVEFNDYDSLFRYLFESSLKEWQVSFRSGATPAAQLVRVYWYVVGSIDEWDLSDPKAQAHLRRQFDQDREVRPLWLKQAAQSLTEKGSETQPAAVADEAWALCFRDFEDWYKRKQEILEGMNRFHYAVEASTDFIEIRRVGHWKVDFLHKALFEKGVDTSFAVDMATMLDAYDVALLISGDADGIPSVKYVKNSGRQVGAVEFLKGYPPEQRAKNLSSKLKTVADFVSPIYEMDLVRAGVGVKPTQVAPAARPKKAGGSN